MALKAAQHPVPNYLIALANTQPSVAITEMAFAMPCFWVGEMKLGAIDGVVNTEAGWIEGREVTKVSFDPYQLKPEQLQNMAKEIECSNKVYAANDLKPAASFFSPESSYRKAHASDQKRQMIAFPPIPNLTPMQATKFNAWIKISKQKALNWLSPNQIMAIKESMP